MLANNLQRFVMLIIYLTLHFFQINGRVVYQNTHNGNLGETGIVSVIASDSKKNNVTSSGLDYDEVLSLRQNISTSVHSINSNQTDNMTIGILDYENKTHIELLELLTPMDIEQLDVHHDPDIETVSLSNWVEDEPRQQFNQQTTSEQSNSNPLQELLRPSSRPTRVHNTLRNAVGQHNIRHAARKLSTQRFANSNVMMSDQPTRRASNSSLRILQTNQRFNMTVGVATPFRNIDTPKLLEIVLLMRSDCTLLPSRIVRWVSKKRGILFECTNGAWVVTYLRKKSRRRVRPSTVTDCHEAHLQGKPLDEAQRVMITYSNGKKKDWPVLCRHVMEHTDHELIDNHINPQPTNNFAQRGDDQASSWTIIQRRINGNESFYRSTKAYKRGFGDPDIGDYWMGLVPLHEMTHLRKYELRVSLTTLDNKVHTSDYTSIRVGSEARNYRLKLGAYILPLHNNSTLPAGDILSVHAGGSFHARDSQNFTVNCAQLYGTAFWFRGCWASVNLNGPYVTDSTESRGVRWAMSSSQDIVRVWKTEIMIRPVL